MYTGTQPANANTALSGNMLLATLTFGNPAFGAPASGMLTANAISPARRGRLGTATFARIYKSDGTTVALGCDRRNVWRGDQHGHDGDRGRRHGLDQLGDFTVPESRGA